LRPRAQAAAMPSLMRWRMRLRSNFGEGGLDMKKRTAGWRGGVERLVERAETHAAALQLSHEPEHIARTPPEAVEV
jgi:hypothetical protein